MQNKHILIVGSGSVGKRHARNFSELGCSISCVDPRSDRTDELNKETKTVLNFKSLQEALNKGSEINGVAICTPTSFHVEQAIETLEYGVPVLLEKPVSNNLKSALKLQEKIRETRVPLLLGYTWRWWPALKKIKKYISNNKIGKIYNVQFVMSAHLEDWHPWESYKDFFMAKKELGGGALLDESHWIDIAIWFFGMPHEVTAYVDRISMLDITSDDNVDILFKYDDGLRISIHLDLYGRPHEKSIRLVGEHGTLKWDVNTDHVLFGEGISDWKIIDEMNNERNDMFMSVAKEYLDVLEGKKVSGCTIEDGLQVMKVIEAIRFSSKKKCAVNI
jgi:predicted dehydrogenase